MVDELGRFLELYPLATKWLSDIVDALLARNNGTAHVRELARELWGDHDINEIESTITRRLNDFCSDAQDFKKSKEFDLFARVAPATYRLRGFPNKPDIVEIQRIEFEDAAMQSTWDYFSKLAGQKDGWAAASKRKRLTAFSRFVAKEPGLSVYRDFANPPDLGDLGL
jgi:hypothetical protein